MPETAINKNSEFLFAKREIRFTRKQLMSTPAMNLMRPEDAHERYFRGFVLHSVDPGHHLRALGLSENISHNLVQEISHNLGNLTREKGWHGIPHLVVLLGTGSFKEIVVRKCLQTGGFSYC